MPKTWIVTDTHFGHASLVRNNHRPSGYEDRIKAHWLSLVAPEDTIYHLGDVTMSKPAQNHKEYVAAMPGYKILIRGNHDMESDDWYLAHGWDEVHDAAWVTVGTKEVMLSHVPRHVSWGFDVNVHGHFHDNDHRKLEPEMVAVVTPKHKLLALERTNYAPVLLESFL